MPRCIYVKVDKAPFARKIIEDAAAGKGIEVREFTCRPTDEFPRIAVDAAQGGRLTFFLSSDDTKFQLDSAEADAVRAAGIPCGWHHIDTALIEKSAEARSRT